jgi:3',5'-cyclic AMP phosphodiesterase CpdA
VLALVAAAALLPLLAGSNGCAASRQSIVPPQTTEMDDRVLARFKDEIDEYVVLRKKALAPLPSLGAKATREEVTAHKKALTTAIIAYRKGSRQGEIFKPDVAAAIRRTLQRAIAGPEGQGILKEIQSGNPKLEGNPAPSDPTKEVKQTVNVAVNAVYNDAAPFSSVPPSLLLKLPPLPEEVRYRFVGRTLIIRDTEANVILDFVDNAIPDPSQAKPVDTAETGSGRYGKGEAAKPTPPVSQAEAPTEKMRLPLKNGSVRFAVMGDTGTGSKAQYEMGRQMAAFHDQFPFEFVIMLGDDLYGGSGPGDFRLKFELPYDQLIASKVKFYASIGNHDNPSEDSYKDWNMGGKRYYTFRVVQGKGTPGAGTGVRFFVLDSNYMDKVQLDWLEGELKSSASEWKIAYFHHPLYSSGRFHGSSLDLRALLEPLFVKYGVSVVFSGHDHIYERIKPQKGIAYFVAGSGGSLRKGNIVAGTGLTEKGFDQDYAFMMVEIDGTELSFQTVSRTGQTVDAGVIKHAPFAGDATQPAKPLPPKSKDPNVPKAPVSPTPPATPPAAGDKPEPAKPAPQKPPS